MVQPLFTWNPDFDSECSVEPNVKPVKFGDGYEARFSDVINVNKENWSVTFERSRTGDGKDILAFLTARKGKDAFRWKTPAGNIKTFVARKWSTTYKQGYMVIKSTFEEVFES